MRTLLASLVMALTLACGGGGGGSSSGSLSISNFTIDPSTAVQGQGGGSVSVTVRIDFNTPGGDGANLKLSEGGQTETLPLSGMGGLTSGTLGGNLTLDTSQTGTFTFQAQLLTSQGAASNVLSQTFTVGTNPFQIQSISPSSVGAGGPAFTLTVTGANFQSGDYIQWNGNYLSTTFVSSTTLQAQVPASDILAPATVLVSVYDNTYGSSSVLPLTLSSGGNQVVALPTNDLVWDPARQVIYATLPSSAGAQGNSIAVIDPVTATVESTVFAGSEPGRLAISDDGSYLYVGIDGANSVRRFLLPSLAADISIPLGSGPYGAGPNHALDLQVAPGAPHTLAVATSSAALSPGFTGVTIFDDATPRSAAIPGWMQSTNLMDSLQWGADASTLFAANDEDTAYDFYQIAVSAGGASVSRDIQGGIGSTWPGRIHYAPGNGKLYSDSGYVVSAASLQQLGTYSCNGPMVPDPALGYAYFVAQSSFYGSIYTLDSFDLDHFTPVSSHNIPVTSLPGGGSSYLMPTRLIRWGADGLAFGGNGGPLYLVSGAFVSGQ